MISLESLKQFLSAHPKEICATVVAGIVFIVVFKRITRKGKKVYPKDTVVHHTIPWGTHAPSISPFPIKLETYLRMAKISYINEYDSYQNRSSKNKMTWIEFNGDKVADSEFCIKYLNKKFNIDLDRSFSDEKKAVAYSMQKMLEENTYWMLGMMRWAFTSYPEVCRVVGFPRLIIPILKRWQMSRGYAQGSGRHTKEEVLQILTEDLNAVSKFLGSKKFILGDTPCQSDCAIFGMLTMPYWHPFSEDVEQVIKKFPNLCNYCERMKSRFWPDWDERITHGGTRPAKT